ncbi:OmpA family protein [Blattabacterium cuenoti]|uniref:OmpA family protein n=1 Tax=Blattabacterium cuenoti TaxID=1653831 RepID=UPI001EEB774D|nr:OmpA family protein [Blattabacterium cuenoti]
MKNVNFFIVILFAFFSSVFSQDSKEKWFIRVGAHDINYYPIRSPLKGFFLKRNNSFNPIISSIELEHNIKKHIGLYLDASLGMVDNTRWRIGNNFFIKFSNGINLYMLPHKKFDPYLRLGIGYHKFNNYLNRELRISDTKYFKTNRKNFFLLDGGLGLNFWLVSNFGLNAQSTYNQVFAKQCGDYLNFWKHNVGLIFRFGNLKINHDHKIVINHIDQVDQDLSEKNDKNESEKNNKNEEEEKEKKIYCQDIDQDHDHDGIWDKEDLCPNQFGLKKFKGCPDTDLDNIPDHEDQCPNQFGLKKFKGCPDTDLDNIPDHEDQCPNQFGLKKFKGCPDTDLDNIPDHEDQCPNQFGLKKFKGCPDTDLDNIPDHEDQCPNQFGLKKFKGCPDTDLDNIPDHEDQCPNQFGLKKFKGCPDIVFRPILFGLGKFSLSTRSLKIINNVANIMINNFPNSKFYINGYTDANGKSRYNQFLSLKRARSVFEALVSKGVDSSRIEVRGLGVGKKKKRCVEIVIRKS